MAIDSGLFISYSRSDQKWLDRVKRHLAAVGLPRPVVWSDEKIGAGNDWQAEIFQHIEEAQCAVLLLSTDFLASPFVRDVELPKIRKAITAGLRVVPVLLRPCGLAPRKSKSVGPTDETTKWLAGKQVRPSLTQSLAGMSETDCDEALNEIASEIREILRQGPKPGPNGPPQEPRLPTGISQAFWSDGQGLWQPASVPRLTGDSTGANVFWLDELFEGGIFLPTSGGVGSPALSLLVTGPPGSGKSTLALELCYRWSCDKRLSPGSPEWSSLYVNTEGNADWLRDKAVSLGWRYAETQILGGQAGGDGASGPCVSVLETADFATYLQEEEATDWRPPRLLSSIARGIGLDPRALKRLPKTMVRPLGQLLRSDRVPEVVVIDSLNTAPSEARPQLFSWFSEVARMGPRLLIIVLDSEDERGETPFWEYAADIVIRLDRTYIPDFDYMVRTLEITKARYQSHTWGRQQLKIYPPSNPTGTTDADTRRARMRAHPYREEGGIFLFPSIHFHLSKYKRSTPLSQPGKVPSGLRGFDTMLKGGAPGKGGLPRARCTGFLGIRGGHKSHLGYVFVLSGIVNNEAKALVVSLRDDEGTANKTMGGILQNELRSDESVDSLEQSDRLEVLYYPPGYITPEEFFHRIFVSIKKLKRGGYTGNIYLLFNSLDQLSSRFPLCAREKIFVPGITEMLLGERVTSLFIGVKEAGQPAAQYGLLSMADLLLDFEQVEVSQEEYKRYVGAYSGMPERRQVVVARVVRFAGGEEAGAAGILEFVPRKDEGEEPDPRLQVYDRAGLQCSPLEVGYRFESQDRRGREEASSAA